MPSQFHLSCLGEPQLRDGAGEAIRFRTRKHFALLIRLALEPGHAFSRDSLTELLWPDVPPKRARHSLAQGVSVLRAKLGRENLLVRTASVGLRAGAVETDVAQLANGTNGAVRGRFLDGFDVPRSRPFDDWKDQWTALLIPKVRDALTRTLAGQLREKLTARTDLGILELITGVGRADAPTSRRRYDAARAGGTGRGG